MSLFSQFKLFAATTLALSAAPKESDAQAPMINQPQVFPKAIVKENTRAWADSSFIAYWVEQVEGEKARSAENKAITAKQTDLAVDSMSLRKDYQFLRNLSETLLNFSQRVDRGFAIDSFEMQSNKILANKIATRMVSMRLPGVQDDYMKKNFNCSFEPFDNLTLVRYKNAGLVLNANGTAVHSEDLNNPRRYKDEKKRLQTSSKGIDCRAMKNYQPPLRRL